MTTEQFEKAHQLYQNISSVKADIEDLTHEDGISIRLHFNSCNPILRDEKVKNDIDNYILINKQAIRAELLDILKDHLKRLEDELAQI